MVLHPCNTVKFSNNNHYLTWFLLLLLDLSLPFMEAVNSQAKEKNPVGFCHWLFQPKFSLVAQSLYIVCILYKVLLPPVSHGSLAGLARTGHSVAVQGAGSAASSHLLLLIHIPLGLSPSAWLGGQGDIQLLLKRSSGRGLTAECL